MYLIVNLLIFIAAHKLQKEWRFKFKNILSFFHPKSKFFHFYVSFFTHDKKRNTMVCFDEIELRYIGCYKFKHEKDIVSFIQVEFLKLQKCFFFGLHLLDLLKIDLHFGWLFYFLIYFFELCINHIELKFILFW